MNNVIFKNKNYLLIKGTGTKMAPSCANLFIGLIEKPFLDSHDLF